MVSFIMMLMSFKNKKQTLLFLVASFICQFLLFSFKLLMCLEMVDLFR